MNVPFPAGLAALYVGDMKEITPFASPVYQERLLESTGEMWDLELPTLPTGGPIP